jgi:uncharacterized protein (DUF1800 family)
VASIQITFTHPELPQPLTKTFNVEDSQMTRVVQAAKAKLRREPRPGPNGMSGDVDPLTNAEALNRAAEIFWGTLRQMTKQYEVELATQAVAATIQPVEAT